jgi:hypothetical protein
MNREWVTLAFGVLLVTGVVVVSVWQNYPGAPDEPATAPAAAPDPTAAGSPTGEAAPDAAESEPAPTPAPPAPVASRLDTRVSVVHKHRFGDCEGTLRAAAGTLTYSTSHKEDAFQLPFAEIDTFDLAPDKKNLRIRRRGGRTWNFTTRGEAGLALTAFHKEASARRR